MAPGEVTRKRQIPVSPVSSSHAPSVVGDTLTALVMANLGGNPCCARCRSSRPTASRSTAGASKVGTPARYSDSGHPASSFWGFSCLPITGGAVNAPTATRMTTVVRYNRNTVFSPLTIRSLQDQRGVTGIPVSKSKQTSDATKADSRNRLRHQCPRQCARTTPGGAGYRSEIKQAPKATGKLSRFMSTSEAVVSILKTWRPSKVPAFDLGLAVGLCSRCTARGGVTIFIGCRLR